MAGIDDQGFCDPPGLIAAGGFFIAGYYPVISSEHQHPSCRCPLKPRISPLVSRVGLIVLLRGVDAREPVQQRSQKANIGQSIGQGD